MYDVLSAWPNIGAGANRMPPREVKMAMAWPGKNRHYLAETVERRHFDATALKCGVGQDARVEIEELLAATPQVIAEVSGALPDGFPQGLAAVVLEGLRRSADRLAD